jgi:DNA-binding response OmpR family regulator
MTDTTSCSGGECIDSNDHSFQRPRKMRIFIVEHHQDTLKYLRMYLEALGHSVITAETKSEALAAIPSADCDMFICDIGLPDGNGWDLLKDASFSRPVYAIAISGFGTMNDRHRSAEAGYRQHIVKPFGGGDLAPFIEEAARELAA